MPRLRFVTGSDFVSNAIRFGERDGWCTHVEALTADGAGYLGARLDGGVAVKPIGYDAATRTRELAVELPMAADAETAFRAFLDAQLGKPYDITAVAGLAIGRDWRTSDSWFCSELQAAALEACGFVPRLAAADNHISPRDLLLVLSGRLAIAAAE